ncbi:MAG: SPOCS domain-containing protein [Lachnospirales bacterium]
MSILKKENISLDKRLNQEKNQIRLEGDIIVPDIKPDIQKVLETKHSSEIIEVKIADSKVIYKGFLEVKVLYIANDKELYSMVHTLNIDDYFDLPYINENCKVFVDCIVSHIDFRVVNDRKLSYKAVLDVTSYGVEKRELNVVSDIEDNRQATVLKDDFVASSSTFIKEELLIHDEFKIKSTSGNIKEILQVNISFLNKEAKIQNDKIHIYGDLLTKVLYKCEDDTTLVEQIEQETHFSGVLDKAFEDDCILNYKFKLVDTKGRVALDEDNEERLISIDAQILCELQVLEKTRLNLVKDAHLVNNKLHLETIKEPYLRIVSKNKNQYNLKEILSLENISQPMLQIFSVNSYAILDEVYLQEDRTIVSGAINLDVIYITKNDSVPYETHRFTIPYEQTIETKNSRVHMFPYVDVSVENCMAMMISESDLEVKVNIMFNVEITEENIIDIIENICFEEMCDDDIYGLPSIVIHTVEAGETLWSIAKEYNTTVDSIVKLNNLEDPNILAIGQKLIICKKVLLPVA